MVRHPNAPSNVFNIPDPHWLKPSFAIYIRRVLHWCLDL